jgi:hypothetical protein
MQTVIAQFASEAEATSALRRLEAQGYSIQNMMISDEGRSLWRKFPELNAQRDARFVVYSMDDQETSAAQRAEMRRVVYDHAH